MPLLNILQQIKRKGQIQRPGQPALPHSNGSLLPQLRASSTTPVPSERPVDPVVARLKAARKAEREKKEAEARAKKGQAPKKETKPRAPSKPGLRPSLAPRDKSKSPMVAGPSPATREKKPKVSFSQLMKKASLIDQSKMSIHLKAKTKSPEPRPERRKAEGAKPRSSNGADPRREKRPNSVPREGPRGPPARESPNASRAPIPTRRPNSQLEQRLQLKKPSVSGSRGREDEDEEEYESDLGSFIASDEEEQDIPQDYDRDEIWAMFNKGRTRQFNYDDDSDDMEATGAEIFEEEARSKKRAMEEDRREQEEEQRLAELKRRRKMKAT